MADAFFSSILENIYPLVGNPTTMALIVVGFFLIILTLAKINKIVMLMILLPLVVTIAGVGISSFIGIGESWRYIAVLLYPAMGILFAYIYWMVIR